MDVRSANGVKKAADAFADNTQKGLCVCLVPCRTDTRWWQDDAMRCTEIRLIKGRLRFNDKDGAPFPSALLIFGTKKMPIIRTYEV